MERVVPPLFPVIAAYHMLVLGWVWHNLGLIGTADRGVCLAFLPTTPLSYRIC
jgi:hypothetical protein